MDPECLPKSIKRGTKKSLETTPRKDTKHDSQIAPCGAPGELFWRLLGPKGGDRIKFLRCWLPLRSNFGFSVPPGSSGTPQGPPRAPFWVIFGSPKSILGATAQYKRSKENATPKTTTTSQKRPNKDPKQTICRCPSLIFVFAFLPCSGVPGSGFRVSGLLPLCKGWWGHAKRID